MKILLTLLSITFWTLTYGQDFSKQIDEIYSFKPSKLTKKEQETKLPALDKFWSDVKHDTLHLLPLLRNELKTNGHNSFFYYDGAGLLLSLTNNKSDKELAVEAMSKTDIDDIDRKTYVKTLNSLANEGIIVTKAAINILADENYSFFIPQHVLTFNQGYCLTYMLVPQNDKSYVDTLVSIFKSLKPISQKSVITTLWFEYSCKGDSLLKAIQVDKSFDKEVREYSKKILGYTKLSKDQEEFIKAVGKSEIGQVRTSSLQRFSDEAIEELDMTTRLMRKENNCH
jgi:hypothetical protein